MRFYENLTSELTKHPGFLSTLTFECLGHITGYEPAAAMRKKRPVAGAKTSLTKVWRIQAVVVVALTVDRKCMG